MPRSLRCSPLLLVIAGASLIPLRALAQPASDPDAPATEVPDGGAPADDAGAPEATGDAEPASEPDAGTEPSDVPSTEPAAPVALPEPPPTPPSDPPPAAPPPVAAEPDEVVVAGTRVSRTAGSVQVIQKQQLERFEYDDPHSVLAQVPGVYMRGEDGIGLRPNIGIRGANPDRSKKLTLMEDGILFGPAPYSAPAGYFFPLLTRMTQVRVIKGPGAIAYGPQSVGGAIDYISRPVPTRTTAGLDLAAGEYGYGKGHAYFGTGNEQMGFLFEGVRLQNNGFSELANGADTGSTRNEWVVKGSYTIDPEARTKHNFQAKLSYSDEVSNETYLGQSDADFRRNPYHRYAASALDQMKLHRAGAVLTHTVDGPESSYRVKTSAYRYDYTRSWNKLNRLGSASAATVLANAEDPAYAGYHAVIDGRIDSGSTADTLYIGPNHRTFVSQGVQSVLSTTQDTGPIEHKIEVGARMHFDSIKRDHTETGYLMSGGQLVAAGEATLVTARNYASTHALALHATDAMTWRRLTVTPGARVELIGSQNEDYLANTTEDGFLVAVMPGAGAYYALFEDFGVLGGVYRGFSPPAPGSGGHVNPEYSVNYEAGARYSRGNTRAELIGFYNDYSNLTDVCTLASGCLTTNLDRQFDAGEARIYGLEAYATHEQQLGPVRVPVTAAYTMTYGEFLNDFQSSDPIYGNVRSGDSIPYIPRHQFNMTLAVEHRRGGLNGSVTYVAPMREQAGGAPIDEVVATDEQVWADLGAYVNIVRWLRLYTNVRNVFGAENIIGRRPYGARPNAPRWVQVGLKVQF